MALENKLGLTSSADLAREEERLSKKKAVELFENGVLDTLPAGKFSTLQAIHKYLFEDIYDFAGKLRTVNLAKGNFRFAPLMYLEAALANIDKMPQSTFDEIIEKYVEMNIAHPFREGNGRSTRIWLDHILKTEIGKVMDWSKVDKEDYLLAMERSPIKDVEIKVLLKAALTDEINSRDCNFYLLSYIIILLVKNCVYCFTHLLIVFTQWCHLCIRICLYKSYAQQIERTISFRMQALKFFRRC